MKKTIADLDINWIFTIENRKFVYFELDFEFQNPNLENYKIKKDNYIFEIKIRNQLFKFDVKTNSYTYLRSLIYQIHQNIVDIYNKNFSIEGACFKLVKFKETVFMNAFIIEVQEI